MDKRIEDFLVSLEMFKWQLEKTASFHKPEINAYQYLLSEANDFSGVDVDAYVEELYDSLTIENAERLTSNIRTKIKSFDDQDMAEILVTARLLVEDTPETRYTREWVIKAEKASKSLRVFKLARDLTVALQPFGGLEFEVDLVVTEARTLIDPSTSITKSWPERAKKAIDALKALKPRDIAREATLLKTRLEAELSERGFDKDNRQIFFEARELIGACYNPNPTWIADATVVLVAVQVEKALIVANRSLNWWTRNLPSDVSQKPVEVLRELVLESTDNRNMLWVVKTLAAREALNGFIPTCDCGKELGRRDSEKGKKDAKGPYFSKCRDCGRPTQTVASLLGAVAITADSPTVDVTVQDLQVVFDAGKPVNEKKRSKKRGDKKEEKWQ